jgi:hypothetical protein
MMEYCASCGKEVMKYQQEDECSIGKCNNLYR